MVHRYVLPQLVDPHAFQRVGHEDGGLPGPRRAQVQHLTQLAGYLVRSVAIRLVHDEDVRGLEDAGLGHLHTVTQAGRQHDHGRVRGRGHVHFCLAHAHRLDHDARVAGGIEDAHGLGGGQRHPAQMSPGGHRPDEDARVGGVLLHPDPVPQQRPTRVRRRGVDGEDGDPQILGTRQADERGRQRRLAHARRAGQPDRGRRAGTRIEAGGQLGQLVGAVLHQTDRARHSAPIPGQHARHQFLDVHRSEAYRPAGPGPGRDSAGAAPGMASSASRSERQ